MAHIKTWDELTIQDNFLFQKVMQNKRICKKLIEEILQIKIKKIIFPISEKSIDIRTNSKSVRLDVYVEDDANTIYNIEMQTTNPKNDQLESELPKRTRYYQAMIDMDLIGKGKTYDELNQTYIIFICTFDPFGQGQYAYTFRNICAEDSTIELHDQTTKLFLNAAGTHGTATEHTKNFLKYVAGIPTEDSFTRMIDTEVIKTKKEEKWRREYMTLEMELQKHRKEGRAEGIEEGMKKGLEKGMAEATEKTAMEMLRNKLDIELIRKCTRLSLKRIAELSKML